MKSQTTSGHLKHGSLRLKQTPHARQVMGNGNRTAWALKKIEAVKLDWKRGGE